MKKNYPFYRTVLLCVFSVLLINCKKDSGNIPIQTWDYSTFTDSRDGKIYKTVKIGTQEWMAENLDYKTATGSWNYGDIETNGVKYGRLYIWDVALQAVPTGWHLPTDAEWKQLEMTIGMTQNEADGIEFRGTNEGTKLKSTVGWAENGNGTNEFGFTALAGGFRSNSGGYYVIDWHSYWWTATESDPLFSWYRFIASSESQIARKTGYKGDAYYVRCVKD